MDSLIGLVPLSAVSFVLFLVKARIVKSFCPFFFFLFFCGLLKKVEANGYDNFNRLIVTPKKFASPLIMTKLPCSEMSNSNPVFRVMKGGPRPLLR